RKVDDAREPEFRLANASGRRSPQLQIMLVASPRKSNLSRKPANSFAGFLLYGLALKSTPQPYECGLMIPERRATAFALSIRSSRRHCTFESSIDARIAAYRNE